MKNEKIKIAIDLAAHNSGICYKEKTIKTASVKTINDWKNFLEKYKNKNIEFLIEFSNFKNQKMHVINESELLGVIKTICIFYNIKYEIILVNPRQWLRYYSELSIKSPETKKICYPKNLRKFFNKKTQNMKNDDEIDSYLIYIKFDKIKEYLNEKNKNKINYIK